MVRIKLNPEHIKFISLFGKITRVSSIDCIIEEKVIIFIVNKNNGSKAIGKKGINAKRLEELFKKRVKIVELSEDICEFVANLCYPIKNIEIEKDDQNIVITGPDVKTKGLLIGRNSQNLKKLEEQVKRYFKIDNIKVK